jgi:hypothetical protein
LKQILGICDIAGMQLEIIAENAVMKTDANPVPFIDK